MNPIQTQIQRNQTGNLYGVSTTPFHVHNGIDANTIPVKNLGIIAGQITLVAGSATITDIRINTSSVIVVTSQISDNPSVEFMLAAKCLNGSASIFESSGLSTDTVNYILILNP